MIEPIIADQSVRHRPIRDGRVWLAVGLGTGLSPFAPGTFGTILGLPLVWGLSSLGVIGFWLIPVTILLFAVGVPICSSGAKHFERKDPPWVVFDEIAAFPILYILSPFTITTAILGFIIFRFFDILKPWPIKRFEKLAGGVGIMIDDSLAAVHSMIVLKIILMIIASGYVVN